jgi:hypothetical protein
VSGFLSSVEAVAGALAFHSPTTFSWFGKMSPRLTAEVSRALTPKTARDYLLYNLQTQLYGDFYCQGIATPSKAEIGGVPILGMTPFVEQLSEANIGNGYWATGWEVRRVEEKVLFAGKGDLELGARPEDCLAATGTLAPGLAISLRFSKDLMGMSPGFYMAIGDTQFPWEGSRGLVRFYWHVDPDGAVQLMRLATTALNKAALPFRLKALNERNQYTRCDAAVLYVRGEHYAAIASLLGEIYARVLPNMKQGTPAFTKRLAPGLGFAEDPGSDESFGQHRCRLLAEGLLRAHETGKDMIEARVHQVAERFAEEGISLERPYLNPGSSNDYDFEPGLPPATAGRPTRNGTSARDHDKESFLDAARGIGVHLAETAVWYEGQCNWMGNEPEQDAGDRSFNLAYKALGPGLYGGTAGIALFLAELYAVTGEEDSRRTALGAIRQALAHAGVIDSVTRLGLYIGWPGIALAAARIGLLFQEDELIELSRQLLSRCIEEHEHEHEHDFDLVFGKAGAIVASLTLRDMLEEPPLTNLAIRLADELLGSATKHKAGYSWKAKAFKQPRDLTGFSHGTAGVGYVLLELYHATGNEKYRQAAQGAFDYERAHFDPGVGNWPDFREEQGRIRRGKQYRQFMTAWCHGAPGIALSRLRAYELMGDETCKAEATIALRTTRKMLGTTLESGLGNYSLCHGLAGNAEILRYGEQVLGLGREEGADVVLDVAYRGIANYGADPRSWPSGVQGGENPSLMLGLAGVGYFYLRLCSPSTPSVLLLRREDFQASKRSFVRDYQEIER